MTRRGGLDGGGSPTCLPPLPPGRRRADGGMSKGAAKVSVLCGDKGLGRRIRRADKAQRLKEVVTAPERTGY